MARKSNLEKSLEENLGDITEEIKRLSQIGKAIQTGRLKQNAVVILLAENAGVSRAETRKILDALADLERVYLK